MCALPVVDGNNKGCEVENITGWGPSPSPSCHLSVTVSAVDGVGVFPVGEEGV